MITLQPRILFCASPLAVNKVDPDFEDELLAARQNGFETHIFNFDDLTGSDQLGFSVKKIKPAEFLTSIIYRGWMLTPKQYEILYTDLYSRNYKLINSVSEYQNCHYLPDSLKYIEERTPRTVFEKLENENSIKNLIEKAKIFSDRPVIIKDYVKSEKHSWKTACFVDSASDLEKLGQTINNFIGLRGNHLNEGIVIREFIELNELTIHSKSGMPLTEEYRLFFCNKKLIGIYDYWEEGEYKYEVPITREFEEIAARVESKFFSMDIARQKNGKFSIIELGDGQVSGLPEKLNRNEFYAKLKSCCG